jgi:chromosomal replication initiator protein
VQVNLYLANEEIKKNTISPIKYLNSNINELYTFDNYVVTPQNQDAVRAGRKFGEDYAPWNIMFITGGVGVGKTHLMHAIGNMYAKTAPQKNFIFYTSEDIINKIYNSLSINKTEDDTDTQKIKDEFLDFDLLLVDDIQFFGKGKEKITEIFFGIFNKMVGMNKKIIVASDKNLEQLAIRMEQRVVSRLGSGIVCLISNPNNEAIKEIIKSKLSNSGENFKFTDDALQFLTNRSNGDIRKLDGIINTITFQATDEYKNGAVLTTADIQKILNLNTGENTSYFGKSFNPEYTIEFICNYFNENIESVKSSSRVSSLVHTRNICMYILQHKYKLTLNEIGRLFNNRSHSTVLEAIGKVAKKIKRDESFVDLINTLENKV